MLHITIHGAAEPVPGDSRLQERLAPLDVTFDGAYAKLAKLPGMFVEPDGWFAWESEPGEPRWQIAGQLHDRGLTLAHAEVKISGGPPASRVNAFLEAFGWPESPLLFVDVRAGALLDADAVLASLVGQLDQADF
jgi:hypothetical protein